MGKKLKEKVQDIKKKLKKEIRITDDCVRCGKCVKVCPEKNCIAKGKPFVIDPNVCKRCGKCVKKCPKDAIIKVKLKDKIKKKDKKE